MKACNLLSKPDASGTVDASVHMGDNERADVFVLDCSFKLIISAFGKAVVQRVILQITFTSLIANRAVQWMVDEKELHNAASGDSGDL